MAEATAAASNVFQVALPAGANVEAFGGKYFFWAECDKATAKHLGIAAVSMYGIYKASELITPVIRDIFHRWFGGVRDDQAIGEPRPGSLLVELHCFTDERFMKVWMDYESGKMKERLQEEFSKSGIDVEGLKIGIRNLKEVIDIKTRIESRIFIASTLEQVSLVNERDKESHEKNLCQFKVIKYRDLGDIKASQDQMKQKLNGTNVRIDEVERKQDQIDSKVSTIKENVEEIKQTQAEMKQQYENLSEMIVQLLQKTSVNSKGIQDVHPAVSVLSAINQDIIIIGGWFGPNPGYVLNTVRKFNVVEGKAAQLPSMNQPREKTASCVHNNDVIVAGGFDGFSGTDTIEILKMKQNPLAWTLFDGKLPVKLSEHAVVLYQGNIFAIGGHDWNKKKTSDAIYVARLSRPYNSKLLVRMPQAIRNHCAEVANDNLFILGGMTSDYPKDVTDSVFLYDVLDDELKPCASLPRAVWGMSTVTWGNMIIVVGGADKNYHALNEVIMYDTKTGQSTKLPSMIYKRKGCSAVIINDVIVVMGGWNNEQGYLSSVESFTIGGDGWKELPSMSEKIHNATAVVKPGKLKDFTI